MKPILFNTEMVRAILDGRKTVTRRVIKGYIPEDAKWGYTIFIPQDHISCRGVFADGYGEKFYKLPFRPGDVLYVRETYTAVPDGSYAYKASMECPDVWKGTWRTSIHMPKEAARIFLRVTVVKVERLQDITEEQAIKEGARGFWLGWGESGYAISADSKTYYDGPIGAYAHLWNATIKPADRDKYGWTANPWCWVIGFERISKEEAETDG